MKIAARRARLRPIVSADHGRLYAMALAEEIPWQWAGMFPTFESFSATLASDSHFLMAIVDGHRPEESAVGFVGVYGMNLIAQNAFFLMGVSAEARRAIWPIEAALLMIQFAFDRYPLRKLYAETNRTRLKQFAQGSTVGLFNVVAEIPEHSFRNGALVEMVLLALERDDWNSIRSRFSRRLDV